MKKLIYLSALLIAVCSFSRNMPPYGPYRQIIGKWNVFSYGFKDAQNPKKGSGTIIPEDAPSIAFFNDYQGEIAETNGKVVNFWWVLKGDSLQVRQTAPSSLFPQKDMALHLKFERVDNNNRKDYFNGVLCTLSYHEDKNILIYYTLAKADL